MRRRLTLLHKCLPRNTKHSVLFVLVLWKFVTHAANESSRVLNRTLPAEQTPRSCNQKQNHPTVNPPRLFAKDPLCIKWFAFFLHKCKCWIVLYYLAKSRELGPDRRTHAHRLHSQGAGRNSHSAWGATKHSLGYRELASVSWQR